MTKTTTKLLILMAAVSFVVPQISAKHHEHGKKHCMKHKKEKHGLDLSRFKDKLNLSEQQIIQIKAIQKATKEKMQPLKEQKRKNREELHTLMMAESPDLSKVREILKKNADLSVEKKMLRIQAGLEQENILNADQKKTLVDLKKKRHKKMKTKMQERHDKKSKRE